MNLSERTRSAELETLRWELERARASRDSLQVALDDMRRQVRALQTIDLRDQTLTRHTEGVRSK